MADPSSTAPPAATTLLCGQCFHASPPGPSCGHCGAPLRGKTPPGTLPVGTLLDGKFVVGGVLGSPGGFGIAYLGWDRVLQRKVVIKELFPHGLVSRVGGGAAVDPVQSSHRPFFNLQRELFLDEARKLARLDGVDAVARVIHYFAQNDTAYFVMTHVPGTSLAQRLASGGAMPYEQVLQLLWPLAQGLQAIHALGLVHRDIKPENVLIDERERPVLIDFGNATAPNVSGEVSHNFFAVSRSFAAPEQYVNDLSRTGPWTDVYALGALLYFCLSGQRPTDAALRAAGSPLKPIGEWVDGLPPALEHALERALALEPKARPADMSELLALLEPLRPQAFHWSQALPEQGPGAGLRRLHEALARDGNTRTGFNVPAALLQFFWFFAHRLHGPAIAAGLVLLLATAAGLWFRVLPLALPAAWLIAALPCGGLANRLRYQRVAAIGASLPVATTAQQAEARQRLAAAIAPDPKAMLLGFVPPLAGLLLWGLVSDYEEDVRWRVRQAVALDDLRARVASYVAANKVPPQSLQDLGVSFVPNSELSHLELKGGVIEVVLGISGAADRRLRWRLDPERGWICEARDLQPQYTPPGCAVAR